MVAADTGDGMQELEFDGTNYLQWRDLVLTWVELTSLEKRKQGPFLILLMSGHPQDVAIDLPDMSVDNILKVFDSLFGYNNLQLGSQSSGVMFSTEYIKEMEQLCFNDLGMVVREVATQQIAVEVNMEILVEQDNTMEETDTSQNVSLNDTSPQSSSSLFSTSRVWDHNKTQLQPMYGGGDSGMVQSDNMLFIQGNSLQHNTDGTMGLILSDDSTYYNSKICTSYDANDPQKSNQGWSSSWLMCRETCCRIADCALRDKDVCLISCSCEGYYMFKMCCECEEEIPCEVEDHVKKKPVTGLLQMHMLVM